MNRMKQYLHLDCMTCTGKTIGEEIEGAEVFDDYPSYKQVADRDAGVGNGACVLHVSPEAHVGGGIMGLFDVIVIGAGVTGCAVARELSRYRLKIGVLEKEVDAPYSEFRRKCDCYQNCE